MEPIDIIFVEPPEICDDCALKTMNMAANVEAGTNLLMQHCRHHQIQ
jgi:hypothetical protein